MDVSGLAIFFAIMVVTVGLVIGFLVISNYWMSTKPPKKLYRLSPTRHSGIEVQEKIGSTWFGVDAYRCPRNTAYVNFIEEGEAVISFLRIKDTAEWMAEEEHRNWKKKNPPKIYR